MTWTFTRCSTNAEAEVRWTNEGFPIARMEMFCQCSWKAPQLQCTTYENQRRALSLASLQGSQFDSRYHLQLCLLHFNLAHYRFLRILADLAKAAGTPVSCPST